MYIAPEQAQGDPNLDHRADIYALGILAYEMLTGHPPFSGRTPQEIMSAQARVLPAPLLSKRADVPPALANIVMQCLEKSPAKRPQSADEIVRVINDRGHTRGASRIPAWVPWVIAAVATAAAIAMAFRK
jgi:serine/threonine-protein kinase